MKPAAAYAPPRRLASPKKQVRLNLRGRPTREPDDEKGLEPKSSFWKWVGLVALFHLVAIVLIAWIYETAPTPTPPPETFMSLLPPGDVVKGTAGAQAAPKIGPTTPAPSVHHHLKPPPTPALPQPDAVIPPPPPPTPSPVEPAPIQPPPVVQTESPLAPEIPTPPKPAPAKPKIKVDLTLVNGPTANKPAVKPKPHPKKPVAVSPPDDSNAPDSETASNPDSTGLSKEEIAAKLGEKLQAAGVADSIKIGPSGSDHSQANPFADFYLALRDQVMSKWEHPNLTDETAVNPVVMIHVEKDGRVPPESVTLQQSSGNPAYDDSALAAAKSIGYTLQPLPDGCPPDISITFKLTR